MKRLMIALLTMVSMGAMAQNHQDVLGDSAKLVVDRYVQMLAIDQLPADSVLVMKTAITTNQSRKDTIWMHRWYGTGERHRIEVWDGSTLDFGLVSNGKDRFRVYSKVDETWESVPIEELNKKLQGYDFRGPLYRWREKGAQLSWNGTTELKGQPLQVVKIECPSMYTRYYMFEPESGLLTLIFETDKVYEGYGQMKPGHIEWKSVYEYLPVAHGIQPSLESFMRNGVLTILSTVYHFEAMDTTLFEHD